ncbi:recombinase family protein [Nocardia gipuzkoensis]|uniref:recombinase family protein n=1 Tax=Nocardia gipuzkoensis TaxID=2749991 RepID=UPI0015EF19F5|nr:recombinase family protein [Nocardia gipuzkoensis]
MTATLIGRARCSADERDLASQRQILCGFGVAEDRIYLDHGLTGTRRARPGLDQALAAVRVGDTLLVPELDRLARSIPDAREIGDSLVARGVKLSLGGTIYDPTDPMDKMFFNILATFAEFEVDLLRMRTREGMAVAKSGEHTIADLAELFSVSRATVYRVLERQKTTVSSSARAGQ